MTEAEWDASADPTPMLQYLRGKVSKRKLRLFACACVRRVWRLLADERSKRAVEASELFADEKSGVEELRATELAATTAAVEHSGYAGYAAFAAAQVELPIDQVEGAVAGTVVYVCEWEVNDDGTPQEPGTHELYSHSARRGVKERLAQAFLLRDIFGNLFHFAFLDISWLLE
jgi:hypothetical protein